jgi:acyl-[acyl-carrier-protein]-phospholipid O-acyltransferase/long-chain-fatty-acid--[acyl-carrier-protein] ligase
VRGPNIMQGYLRPEAPDAIEAPPGGWYDTGDAVTIDADGFVAIRGRIKRFAKVGGEMVSLAAVEALAHRTWPDTPVAAIALPDPRKGNRVILALGDEEGRLDATLAPLQARARAEGLAEIMLPARVIALEALPLLGSGKPDYPGLERLVLAAEAAGQPA